VKAWIGAAVVALSLGASDGSAQVPASMDNAFVGSWTADLAQSKLRPNSHITSATLVFSVTPEAVSITDSVIDGGQQVGHGTTVFQTDGKEHPHDELAPGMMVVALWRSSRRLETTLKWNGQTDTVTYDVSSDGKTLTNRVLGRLGEQVIVFKPTP
jgi:hypothetical protein